MADSLPSLLLVDDDATYRERLAKAVVGLRKVGVEFQDLLKLGDGLIASSAAL